MDAEGATKVVETLGAKLVIPMHYKTDKNDLPIAKVDGFIVQMTNVKELNVSEVDLSRDKLPSTGHEVWVLNYAC